MIFRAMMLRLIAPLVCIGSSTHTLATPEPSSPRETIAEANAAARVEPTQTGYVNAMQIWPYSPAALYQIYTKPARVTDIALEPGEQLVEVSGPNPVRWILGNTTSGEGDSERVHISLKPTRADLQTNLIIYTNRRTYYLEVTATTTTWMAAVAWEYPQDKLAIARTASDGSRSTDNKGPSLPLDRLTFRYEITGRKVPWRPLRVFDDGTKVYIQFPPDIAQHDLPPLFLIDPKGAPQLVNYRVQATYYIVDRLFDRAELRLGGKKGDAIRIARTDVKTP